MSEQLLDTQCAGSEGVSVVIPVYNAEPNLHALVSRLQPVLEGIDASYELILVNDASPDRSWEMILDLSGQRDWIRGINLMRNYGQHNALLCGIRAARYGIIITMDDDLQHPPEEIPKLLNRLSEGFDVVYGTPESRPHGFWRNLASGVTKLVLHNTMGAETARKASAFRVFRSHLRRAFDHYNCPFVSIDVLLTWGTTRFAAVTVVHDPRHSGVSGYGFRKLLIHAINMLTGFSTLPLQVASFIGFSFTLFGMLVLAYVLIRYFLEGSSVPGFPFLASIIAIFSGAQLLAIGIMGEYLARMYQRIMNRPSYVVSNEAERKIGRHATQ